MGKRTNIFVAFLAVLMVALAGVGVSVGASDGARADEQVFVSGFDDLPLMPGLTMTEEGSVEFDSPQGRLVEAHTQGAVKAEAVQSFYSKVLPELGWVAKDSRTYTREKEILKIGFPAGDQTKSRLAVLFSLSPSQ